VTSAARCHDNFECPDDSDPSWSGDSKNIVFLGLPTGKYGIWIVAANGTHLRELVQQRPNEKLDRPVWSPDGKWIAYVHGVDQSTSIWLIRPDGRGRHQLVAGADEPAWSPNGQRLAYVDDAGHVTAIGSDGSGELNLGISGYAPTWSPDGSAIAYAHDIATTNGPHLTVYAVGASAGETPRKLAEVASSDSITVLSWGPR
jgi:Tol biopolymer transport system component